jgi:hypothetical protein
LRKQQEEKVAEEIGAYAFTIVETAEFMVKLKTPDIFADSSKTDLTRLPSLAKQPTYAAVEPKTVESAQKEDWRQSVQSWRQEIEDRNQLNSNQEPKQNSASVGLAQINTLLQ